MGLIIRDYWYGNMKCGKTEKAFIDEKAIRNLSKS